MNEWEKIYEYVYHRKKVCYTTEYQSERGLKEQFREDKKKKEQSTGDSDELTVEEQTERLEEITEKFALLGIPVIIDRSADEKDGSHGKE